MAHEIGKKKTMILTATFELHCMGARVRLYASHCHGNNLSLVNSVVIACLLQLMSARNSEACIRYQISLEVKRQVSLVN